MPGLCKALGYENCFLVDGGGSSTLLKESGDGNYEVVNVPCDKYSDGTYGKPRTVVNSVILSFVEGNFVTTPEPTQLPTTEAPTEGPTGTAAEAPAETSAPAQSPEKTGCGSFATALSALLTASVAQFVLIKKPEFHKSKDR